MDKQFKVGDVAVCVNSSGCGFPGERGDVVVVTCIGSLGDIRFDGNVVECDPSRFEKMEPATLATVTVGTRVVFIEDYDGIEKGTTARVSGLLPDTYTSRHDIVQVVTDDAATESDCFVHRVARLPDFMQDEQEGAIYKPSAPHCAEAEPAPENPFNVGDEVELTDDYGFSDKGDRFVITAIHGDAVESPSGKHFPADILKRVVRDFRIVAYGIVGAASYPSEQSAVDAATSPEVAWCGREFSIVELVPVASYVVRDARQYVAEKLAA